MPKPDYEARWVEAAGKLLLGKTITAVRYLTEEEMKGLAWYRRSIVIELSDGTLIWPSSDDEGNDAGALFTSDDKLATIPVI